MTERIRYKRRLLFWGLLILAGAVWMPVQVERADALSGGPDAYGYNWRDNIDFDYSQSIYSVSIADGGHVVEPIGFDFDFYGEEYEEVTVTSEGGILFGQEVPLPPENEPLTSTEFIGVFAFWDDLDLDSGGYVYTDTQGMSPNRVFVVEYRDVPREYNNPPYYYLGDASFEIKLFESSNAIELHYDDTAFGDAMYDNGGSATVGIVDGNQGYYLTVSHNAISLSPGYAVRFEPPEACEDNDLDGWTLCDGDCDDTEASTHPGATELCDDGIDSNCDGLSTNESVDLDGDGYSSCAGDCDDTTSQAYPGNTETCDFIDNDCDGWVDNGFDNDGDGWTTCEGDCDDADIGTYPSAIEACDGVDSDCLQDLSQTEVDDDGDGFSECDGDCHDGQASAYPGAEEVCDGVDNDCDPDTNEQVDGDMDGWTLCAGDCNDADAGMNPSQMEICDKKDNDCDGQIDNDIDDDHDGYSGCGGEDCNDYNAGVNPGAQEVPYDNIDQDCDGTDFKDMDGDGHDGGPGYPDCDDGDAEIHPEAAENCDNGLDDNCDGAIDLDDETCEIGGGGGGDDGGCSCEAGGSAAEPSALALIGLVLIAAIRRQR